VTAEELHRVTERACSIAGSPSWPAPDGGVRESLTFIADLDGSPAWALTPAESTNEDDCVPLAVELAAELLKQHFREWLLARAWQVQAGVRGGKITWRLADCLSPLDGGGDRLDTDYPCGVDELEVLCAAVRAVAAHTR
jgi:hypothetical protein